MEKDFDIPETTQEIFTRFFAYDLHDRYPNHKIAFEVQYSLRLLWEAQKSAFRIGRSAESACVKFCTMS